MIDFITAEEARRNAESCRGVVAESPLVDVNTKQLFVLEDGKQTLENIVLDEIFKEISKQSYRGKNRAKIAIVDDRRIVNNTDFTKISSRLKDYGFDSIYGGNDKNVEMLVEW